MISPRGQAISYPETLALTKAKKVSRTVKNTGRMLRKDMNGNVAVTSKSGFREITSSHHRVPGILSHLLLVLLLSTGCLAEELAAAKSLTLHQATELALQNDAELVRLQLAEASASEQAVAAGQLPDPVVKLGLLNLPSDTFALDQEPMTQFRIGLMQQFPAGDTLDIRSEQVILKGQTNRILRIDRRLKIRRDVQNLWLEINFWQQNQAVLNEDRALFAQLIEVTQSLYGVGKVNQQDVLGAELELSRLQDRALNARLQEQELRAKLSRWIGPANKLRPFEYAVDDWTVPAIEQIEQTLLSHPQIQLLDLEVDISGKSLELAQQGYKPQWGAEVGYGKRDGKNPDGSSRADFLSAAISVQLPLFTGKRQDKSTRAAQLALQATRYQRQDMLFALRAQVDIEVQRERKFRERISLYQQKIIPMAAAQSTASMNSYQADTAAFAEVVRAALQVQQLRLDLLKIQLQRRQAIARLRYLLPQQLSVQTPPTSKSSGG